MRTVIILFAAFQASRNSIGYGWTFSPRKNLGRFGHWLPSGLSNEICSTTSSIPQPLRTQHGCSPDRRRIMGYTVASAVWLVSKSSAAEDVRQFSIGLLDSRVTENVLSPPPYGMEGNDIYYPSWFAGTWNVRSVCTEVTAPCDIPLFGGEAKFQSAQQEIGKPVAYQSRFLLRDGGEAAVADREFNVVSIAKATMGDASVVNVSASTPNRLSVLLAIGESGGLVQADLLTLNRRQETAEDSQFDCAEAVQEIVSAPSGSSKGIPQAAGPKILKQIETASLYKRTPDGSISCRQRSATFLLPSQQDAVALRLWQITRGRPIDVRFYDVEYSKD